MSAMRRSCRPTPPLRIDFADRAHGAWRWGVFALGLVACLWIFARSAAPVPQLGTPGRPLRPASPQPAQVSLQAQPMQQVQRRIDMPWGAFLAAIDASSTDDVVLLACLPDPVRGTARLEAEAATPEAMLAFIEALGRQAVFSDAWLVEHEVRVDAPMRPLHFSVALRWRTR